MKRRVLNYEQMQLEEEFKKEQSQGDLNYISQVHTLQYVTLMPMLQILCNTFNYICSAAHTFPLWFSFMLS